MQNFNIVLVVVLTWNQAYSGTDPSCDSLIYCQGDLLDTVQRSKIFKDSKTFVDMPQINPPEKTLRHFEIFKQKTNNPTNIDIRKFVEDNFVSEEDLEPWTPPDYNPNPKFLNKIEDVAVKELATYLVRLLPTFGRKVKKDVFKNENRYSLIPVPHGFIIPGGRFRELSYWDSYWLIKGLLLCEMRGTALGIIENFLTLIKKFGYVPSGGRVYYLNRSQPPMLTLMVGLYIDATKDMYWLSNNIRTVEKELYWWLDNRTVTVEKDGVNYTLAHYGSSSGNPRPESYMEDISVCAKFETRERKEDCYRDIIASAESGWDFSSRWIFDSQGGIDSNVSDTQTRRVIPVDLNSYLCKSFRVLSLLFSKVFYGFRANIWSEKAALCQKAIEQVLYDIEDGIWYDYDIKLARPRKMFYPSNFAPLWAENYLYVAGPEYAWYGAKYFLNKGIEKYEGGVPTSLNGTGEQWDFPNAWPPLQELVVLGFKKNYDLLAKQLAELVAKRWLSANIRGYKKNKKLFEKYNAVNPGQYGTGRQYHMQGGFGGTFGVVLSLIKEYYDKK